MLPCNPLRSAPFIIVIITTTIIIFFFFFCIIGSEPDINVAKGESIACGGSREASAQFPLRV